MTSRSEGKHTGSSCDRVLVVGVGNVLLGDEGLGVHVARALLARKEALPAGVEVLDAGTSLLDLLGELARCRRVILVDAVRAGGEPGTIYRAELAEGLTQEPPQSPCLSLHEWGLFDVLRAAERLDLLPRQLSLIGAEPGTIEPGLRLSSPLERAAQGIVAKLTEELQDD